MGLNLIKNIDFRKIKGKLKRPVIIPKGERQRIADVIVERITQGSSPVRGEGRYAPYADSTQIYKGRPAPVDLIDSGNMLNSLIVIQLKKGMRIKFSRKNARKIASHHQNGDGKLPVRKIIPVKSEKFTVAITLLINSIMTKAVFMALKDYTKNRQGK